MKSNNDYSDNYNVKRFFILIIQFVLYLQPVIVIEVDFIHFIYIPLSTLEWRHHIFQDN